LGFGRKNISKALITKSLGATWSHNRNKWVFNRRLKHTRLSDCLGLVGKEFHTRGQQRQNTGRHRWSVYVGRHRSQSQTNRVDADGHRRRVDNHLPSTTVPGHLDTSTTRCFCCVSKSLAYLIASWLIEQIYFQGIFG